MSLFKLHVYLSTLKPYVKFYTKFELKIRWRMLFKSNGGKPGKPYLFQAINEATDAFEAWGEYYTMDCNKVRRNADDKWFIRNQIKLQKLKERSMLKLKC